MKTTKWNIQDYLKTPERTNHGRSQKKIDRTKKQ